MGKMLMYSLLKPLLFKLDPETAHTLVKSSRYFLPRPLLRTLTAVKSSRLECQIGSTLLKNPIGLAAGFDKNGEAVDFMGALGFGFVEIGSVTALPCLGNPKPRIFRQPETESLVNKMGLPNWGVEKIAYRLHWHRPKTPIGISIAKTPGRSNGIDDYVESFRKLAALGNYTVLNLSCPNTDEGTTFEDPKLFLKLATAIAEARMEVKDRLPILIKISPTLPSELLQKIIEIAMRYELDGFVVGNTLKVDGGGLSGKKLKTLADAQLKQVYEIVKKEKIIMGVGGIMSFEDLRDKLALGATFFQVYTGLIYRGPFFIKELCQKLDVLCQKLGVKNYAELVGNSDILEV